MLYITIQLRHTFLSLRARNENNIYFLMLQILRLCVEAHSIIRMRSQRRRIKLTGRPGADRVLQTPDIHILRHSVTYVPSTVT
jgi:hypothetical protein